MLGGNEKRDVRRLQGRLEELDVTAIPQLEVRLERTLAYGACRVDRGKEADLVVRLGRVPLPETVHVNVLGVPTTFAWRNERVLYRVLFVKTHIADRAVSHVGAAFTTDSFHRFVFRIFYKENTEQK